MAVTLYPEAVANCKVPKGVFIVAHVSTMSGEICTDYFIREDLQPFKVEDWSVSRPHPVNLFEMCELTGETENEIMTKARLYFEGKKLPR